MCEPRRRRPGGSNGVVLVCIALDLFSRFQASAGVCRCLRGVCPLCRCVCETEFKDDV